MTRALSRGLKPFQKNYIVNGAMMISQENGNSLVSANSSYPVDEFQLAYSHAGTVSAQQIASMTLGGSPNRLRITVGTADASVGSTDSLQLRHRIEGLRCADLKFGTSAAKNVALQFGVKAPAGTYCVALLNGSVGRYYIWEYTITPAQANTDQIIQLTAPGDLIGAWATDNTIGLHLFWSLMAGSSSQGTAGLWGTGALVATSNQFNLMGTSGNVFELFDVGLYEGTAAPAFQLPEFTSELAVCRRYWRSSYIPGTPPGSATGVAAIRHFPEGVSNYANLGAILFDQPMRATPTVTLYAPQSGTAGSVRNMDSGTDLPGGIADPQVTGFFAFVNNTSTGTSATLGFHYKANARM